MSFLKSIEHRIKRVVFALCRLFLKIGRTNVFPLELSEITKVLFLRPEKIGDMVISLPTFDALKAQHPHIKISVLASPRSYSLVKNDPRFERVYLYRKRLFADIKELLSIRRARYDCIFDMIDDDSVTTLFYSQLASRKAIRIGIGKVQHAAYYDFNHTHADGIGEHIVDNTLKLLQPFGINGDTQNGFSSPYIPAETGKRIDDILKGVSQPGNLLVGFNLSAGRPNRIWPGERAATLVSKLLDWKHDLKALVIVAPGDRQRGEELVSQSDDRVSIVPDGLSLIDVSDLIARLHLLISPDTSLIHIARSFDVPVVGLYSRAGKNFTRWQPYRQLEGAVVGEHIDDIHDITPGQVFDRVKSMLQITNGVDV